MRLEIEKKNHILLASLFEVVSTLRMNENQKNFIADISTLIYSFIHLSFILQKIAFISNIFIPSQPSMLIFLPSSLESSQKTPRTSHPSSSSGVLCLHEWVESYWYRDK
ncbi:hypothetical protein ACKWTF_000568 [Chironomus riparius]